MKIFVLLLISLTAVSGWSQNNYHMNACNDMGNYSELVNEVAAYRPLHLVSADTFKAMAARPNVIILDTRSQYFFDAVHVKGARHLDFSDFNFVSLSSVIPSRETIILIYCNNNFYGEPRYLQTKNWNPQPKLLLNYPLNIPVMVTLFGYGYKNVYELGEYLDANSGGLELEGSEVK